ncbi:hypothetical protein, partial [Rufibacter sp. LB8]
CKRQHQPTAFAAVYTSTLAVSINMKSYIKRTIILCLLIALISSCRTSKDFLGYYSSNFGVSGWFITELQLNNDSTFNYRFSGDLFIDESKGAYDFHNDTLYLMFAPKQTDEFTSSLPDSVQQKFRGLEVPNYAASERPGRLLYKNGKLFELNSKGKVVKRKQSNIRKWILWGDTNMKDRKYFLEKRTNKSLK